jgi:putative aldouronate transport system substrate-binding protein
MKRKKIFNQLVTLTMSVFLATALTACGGQSQKPTSGGSDKKVEISVAVWDADNSFAKGDEVLSKIEDKLNIKIVPMNVTWDDYTQKIQLWASSGSLPDVFVGDFRTTTSYSQWANQGLIKAIPKDLSKYPNLQNYLSDETITGDAKINGDLYCIPRKTYLSQEWTSTDRVIAYRWDLAKKAGITKEPENWNEFQDMMKAITKADPDKSGVGGMTAVSPKLLAAMFLPYASPISADMGANFKWVKDNDGQYKPAYFAEDMKPAFQLSRDMYNSGVIEKDIALSTDQSSNDKFLQGKSAAILTSGGFGSLYAKVGKYWNKTHGTEFLDDVKALKLMPDKNGNKTYPMWGYAWSESFINANVDDTKLDKILQLYDYLLSDEGSIFSTYGPEGKLYDLVDGKVKMHDDSVIPKDTYPSTDTLSILARWNPSTYDDRFVPPIPKNYLDVDKALVDEAKKVKIPEYNQKCSQIVKEKQINFAVRSEDDIVNIMTGTEPVEKMWDDTVKQYEKNGLNDAINQVNSALSK